MAADFGTSHRLPSTPRTASVVSTPSNLRAQSTSSNPEPDRKTVRVAVLPPRLPSGMAPPTGIGMSDCFGWDEAANWTHNLPARTPEEEAESNQRRKFSLSTYKPKNRAAAYNKISFVMREIPYDVWRKHYAKDKDGNFKGTGTPAEDCLLLPHDVERWRTEPIVTRGDAVTRGKIALPAYAAPEHHRDTLPRYSEAEEENAEPAPETLPAFADDEEPTDWSVTASRRPTIITQPKRGWKANIQRGLEMASFGG